MPRRRRGAGEGAGLGLAIVKRIVDGLDGSIVLENRETGIRVTIMIPPMKQEPSLARATGEAAFDHCQIAIERSIGCHCPDRRVHRGAQLPHVAALTTGQGVGEGELLAHVAPCGSWRTA